MNLRPAIRVPPTGSQSLLRVYINAIFDDPDIDRAFCMSKQRMNRHSQSDSTAIIAGKCDVYRRCAGFNFPWGSIAWCVLVGRNSHETPRRETGTWNLLIVPGYDSLRRSWQARS